MATFDQSACRSLIFTYKEGLLSKIAHDLKLEVSRFHIAVEPGEVRASFDTGSIRVVCAQREGRDAPSLLSDRDKRKIESQIITDVLHSRRHPEASFSSEGLKEEEGGMRVRGRMKLHGREREVSVAFTLRGEMWEVEFDLNQLDYGIKPFSAAFGTLRVRPKIRVRLEVPSELIDALRK